MTLRAWCLCTLLCVNSIAAYASAQLKGIKVNQQGDKMSLFITINGPFTHKLFTLSNPNRVVVDLVGTDLAVNLNQLGLSNSLIQNIRSGKTNPSTLRLVVDVTQPVKVSTTPWQSQGIRLDLIRTQNSALTKPLNTAIKQPMPQKPAGAYTQKVPASKVVIQSNSVEKKQPIIVHKQPIKALHTPSPALRTVIVVLDAGHGGKDPGARGPNRSQEKDVVLAITLKLKRLIDSQPGMRAVLTRSGDYYVGLRKRLDIARKYNGDIFVSIHADAFNNPHSHGASVFALSQRGATSEAARWIAEKENYSELGGVNLGDLDDQNGVVRSVLIDLSQTATINAGLQMGGRVLSQLYQFTPLHNNKVEQAGFVVLKSTDIPSILVETGFISNPIEERNLTSPAYQSRLSQAIFQGVKGYFWENPPHGSRIEAMVNTRYHLVRAGETLATIAQRYHVSVGALQAMNHLGPRGNPRPGQKLVIPSTWS